MSPSRFHRRSVRGRLLAAVTAATITAVVLGVPQRQAVAQSTLPAQLSDSAFWKLVGDLSEPAGYFRSDNLLSNELTMQYVIPRLQRGLATGGVYLGVGPEQNFTYIAALRPKMAFIFDIRRGNLVAHMMYKGLFEMSATRADFMSRLFSRTKPAGSDTISNVNALIQAIAAAPADSNLYFRTFAALKDSFRRHGFALSEADLSGPGGLEYILSAFYYAGPWLDYNYNAGGGGGRGGGGARRPTYGDLIVSDDGSGMQRNYLANDVNFRVIKDMHAKNLIVPLVGDFAGPKAIRAVGAYLRSHNATVSAVYTSNVEQYLFQQGDDWSRYYTNVGTLPIDSASTFIRSFFNNGGGMSSVSLLHPITDLLKAFREGRIYSYNDVIGMSR